MLDLGQLAVAAACIGGGAILWRKGLKQTVAHDSETTTLEVIERRFAGFIIHNDSIRIVGNDVYRVNSDGTAYNINKYHFDDVDGEFYYITRRNGDVFSFDPTPYATRKMNGKDKLHYEIAKFIAPLAGISIIVAPFLWMAYMGMTHNIDPKERQFSLKFFNSILIGGTAIIGLFVWRVVSMSERFAPGPQPLRRRAIPEAAEQPTGSTEAKTFD